MVQVTQGDYPSLWAAHESIAPKIRSMPQPLLHGARAQQVLKQKFKELRLLPEPLKTNTCFCLGDALTAIALKNLG